MGDLFDDSPEDGDVGDEEAAPAEQAARAALRHGAAAEGVDEAAAVADEEGAEGEGTADESETGSDDAASKLIVGSIFLLYHQSIAACLLSVVSAPQQGALLVDCQVRCCMHARGRGSYRPLRPSAVPQTHAQVLAVFQACSLGTPPWASAAAVRQVKFADECAKLYKNERVVRAIPVKVLCSDNGRFLPLGDKVSRCACPLDRP
jgi:hypothetical protein